MLAERIEGWFDEATRKGMQQGMQQGEALALQRLLSKRFGSLSAEVKARIESASVAQIECWFDHAIDASTIDAVFGPTQH